jgi:hypothetical protein
MSACLQQAEARPTKAQRVRCSASVGLRKNEEQRLRVALPADK